MRKATLVYFILFCMVSITAEAKKNPFGNDLFWEVTADGTLIISGQGDMPDYWNEKQYDVCASYAPWDDLAKKMLIKRVEIEEGITHIGVGAFNFNFVKSWVDRTPTNYRTREILSYVSLPSSLKSIGECAFYGNKNLKHIRLNEGLECIGDHAFDGTGIESIDFPNSLRKIGDSSFANSKLKYVTFSNHYNKILIEHRAFENCELLQSVNLPEGLKEIESWTFASCPSLVEIIIPSSVKKVGEGAFLYCKNLQKITFKGQSVSEFAERAFVNNYRPTKYYSGKMINIPYFINFDNCEKYGISKIAYKNSTKSSSVAKSIVSNDSSNRVSESNNSYTQRSITVTNSKSSAASTGSSTSRSSTSATTQKPSSSSSTSSTASSNSSSSTNNSGSKTTTVVVEHHRDPVPVQEWVQCGICYGDGKCMTCFGRGTGPGSGGRCISCGYSGKCRFCNGQGGRYQTVYR